MADEATTTEETTTETTETTEDQRVPYERFQQANTKAREASEKAAKLEKDLAKLQRQMEEREEQGLPELDQLKKRLDAAEKQRQEAESRAEQAEKDRERSRKERWVLQAAAEANFADPDDATRFVDLDEIDDTDSAARAVKQLAKKKGHLVKAEETQLPGKVLDNGQRTENGKPASNIDLSAEAQAVAEGLKQFASSS